MSSMPKKKNTLCPENYDSVTESLKKLYKMKLLPLEENYKFHDFQAPRLEDSDYEAPPMIMLIGQYSTGKTSFIRYLLGDDYMGMRIGPEPTTDGFHAIMYGESNREIPGNALIVDSRKQFRSLGSFGNNFLNRFNCSELQNSLLKNITIIDTPGILAGDKQNISRGYDFVQVTRWFAERSDRIMLMFDAHKLDISDEFKRVIEAIRPYDTKIRVVLNKADSVKTQQLMRVYGALMWSLGKVIQTPEVSRVYIGSFWDQPLVIDDYRDLFELEQRDLFEDLRILPRDATLRKLNDFIRRSRLAKINALIISSLAKEMPMFGKEKKKAQLINDLQTMFKKLTQEHGLSFGDFPDVLHMQERLKLADFSKFKSYNAKLSQVVDTMLESDVGRLMELIPKENSVTLDQRVLSGGIFAHSDNNTTMSSFTNPFVSGNEEGINFGMNSEEWVVNSVREEYDRVFDSLPKENGKITGPVARQEIIKTKLPTNVLGLIWKLSDVDKDGKLTKDEWALLNYLCSLKIKGHDIPTELPVHLKPPAF